MKHRNEQNGDFSPPLILAYHCRSWGHLAFGACVRVVHENMNRRTLLSPSRGDRPSTAPVRHGRSVDPPNRTPGPTRTARIGERPPPHARFDPVTSRLLDWRHFSWNRSVGLRSVVACRALARPRRAQLLSRCYRTSR